jgi:hypothetical protein
MGVERLGEDTQQMFYAFLENFISRQGSEGQETFKPISVEIKSDKENGEYLKFDYEMYSRKCWLHVIDSGRWY